MNEVDGAGVAELGARDGRGDDGALADAGALPDDEALADDGALAPLRGPDAETEPVGDAEADGDTEGVKIAGCGGIDGEVVQEVTAAATQTIRVAAPTAVAVLAAAPALITLTS